MNKKISDFKIAESVIRKLCKKFRVSFVDVSIFFDEDVEGALFIGETKNISHTMFKIVSEYINKSLDITGVQFLPDEECKNNFLVTLASNLRVFMYGDNELNDYIEEPHVLRLYQFPLVWILLKNIICPAYNKDLVNLKIICDNNAQFDIAKYCKKEDISVDGLSEESFIFLNIIDNRTIQNASIFIEALRAFDLSPIEVVKKIYESDLYEKYYGLLKIALDEEELSDFECVIMSCVGVDFYSLISKKIAKLNPNFIKTSQNSVPGLPNQFWQLGILEKMMEPARGADWSVYKSLEPYVKEFWNKVEDVRQKRIKNGHDDGVPFDVLLRIKQRQTVGYKTDTTKTLQSLLSSDRVW